MKEDITDFDGLDPGVSGLDDEKMKKIREMLEKGHHHHGHEDHHHHHHESIWQQLFRVQTLLQIAAGLLIYPIYKYVGIQGIFVLLSVIGLYFIGFFHSIYGFVRNWTVKWRAKRLIKAQSGTTIAQALDNSTRLWKLGMMLPSTDTDRDIFLCIASLMHVDGFGIFTDYIKKQWVMSKDIEKRPRWIAEQAKALGALTDNFRAAKRLFSMVVLMNATLYPNTSPLCEFEIGTISLKDGPRLDGVQRVSKDEMEKLRKSLHECANSCVYAGEAFLDLVSAEGPNSGFGDEIKAEVCARAALALWNEYSVHLGGGGGRTRKSVLPDVKEWLNQALHYNPENSLASLICAKVAEVSLDPEKAITSYWKWLRSVPPDSCEYPAICYQTASLTYKRALSTDGVNNDIIKQIHDLYQAGEESEEVANKLWRSLNRTRFVDLGTKHFVRDVMDKYPLPK